MKKFLLIALALAVIGIIVALAWMFIPRSSNEQPPTPITNVFPLAGTNPSATTNSNDGDFLNDSDVAEDPVNPGYYYLGYQTFGTNAVEEPPYLIEFIKETSYFNVTILKEPIGEVRLSTESYLLNKLFLTREELCRLNYTVGVPNTVNSSYSSMNLGFSFCPGAVKLP